MKRVNRALLEIKISFMLVLVSFIYATHGVNNSVTSIKGKQEVSIYYAAKLNDGHFDTLRTSLPVFLNLTMPVNRLT